MSVRAQSRMNNLSTALEETDKIKSSRYNFDKNSKSLELTGINKIKMSLRGRMTK
jgi:hypothetical protein